MRLLHTSDWHLGLELGGHDRLEEQKLFLEWLVGTCRTENVDALLVSGDVYDVANPSLAAQSAFAEFVVGFRRALPAASMVVVAGNHDSGARLELPRPFAQALGGLHLVGAAVSGDNALDKHLVALHGKDGKPAAWCLAVPFLRPSDIECRVGQGESIDQAFSRSVGSFYRNLSQDAKRQNPLIPVVAMGHLTLAGSDKAGSERILIGGVESVAVAALADGADYVALGHIHRCQTVGRDSVRYCGSPLAMDFDERRHAHRVLRVDLEVAGAAPVVRPIDVPVFVPLMRFPDKAGTWSELERAVTDFDWSKWDAAPRELQPLVELQFRPEGAEADLRARTEALCKGRPFRLVGSPRRIAGVDGDVGAEAIGAATTDLRAMDAPQELFVRHWKRKYGIAPPEETLGCFREILDGLAAAGSRP
jgi:DNA repair protein SbcD/Mre11